MWAYYCLAMNNKQGGKEKVLEGDGGVKGGDITLEMLFFIEHTLIIQVKNIK